LIIEQIPTAVSPIFILEISPQVVSTNRILIVLFNIIIILPIVIFFLLKVIKPSLERESVNIVGASIGVGVISLTILIGVFLTWASFRNASRTLVTLYEDGCKIANYDVLIPYNEVSVKIIPMTSILNGIVLETGKQIEIKSIKDERIKVSAAIHDKTGIPKEKVDDLFRILKSR
jgi:hypothetical protein